MKSMMRFFGLALCICLSLGACATASQFQALSPQEKAEYKMIAPEMSVDQRKEYLAQGSEDARMTYLKGEGLYNKFYEEAAFMRLEEAKKTDFLKAYLNMSPDQVDRFMATYDVDTQDRIKEKELQHGWSNKEVILSLGQPSDILENAGQGDQQQLWIYPDQEAVTYLYFENGQLTNWAK